MSYILYHFNNNLGIDHFAAEQCLVDGFKHECYFPFHIWDNPSQLTNIFQDGYCTTNQMHMDDYGMIMGFLQGGAP